MQQPGAAPPAGPQRRSSAGTKDSEFDAQENTPLVRAGKVQDQQQQQLHSSSYLWQQFKSLPPVLQQRQQDEVSCHSRQWLSQRMHVQAQRS